MLYIDNTYISSLEELKAIIESHAKDKSSKKQADFRVEYIEVFETGDLQNFLESLHSEESTYYLTYLKESYKSWQSLSDSNKFNYLIAYFTNERFIPDLSQYFEVISSEIIDNYIVINIKVLKTINEWLSLEFTYFNNNREVVRAETFKNIESLSKPIGTPIIVKQHLHLDDGICCYIEVKCDGRIITKQGITSPLLISSSGDRKKEEYREQSDERKEERGVKVYYDNESKYWDEKLKEELDYARSGWGGF